jgi:hypothetical protein
MVCAASFVNFVSQALHKIHPTAAAGSTATQACQQIKSNDKKNANANQAPLDSCLLHAQISCTAGTHVIARRSTCSTLR